MRIKPILFNTDMVRAILEDRKGVTRRICRDCNDYIIPDMGFYDPERRTYAVHGYTDKAHQEKLFTAERPCPVCPGDILYIRETWAFISCIECNRNFLPKGGPWDCYDTRAVEYDDGGSIQDGCFIYKADYGQPGRITWRPSIHMPKAAARIWLEVKDVRVERLQGMALDDFLAEGVTVRPESFNDPENAYLQAKAQFAAVWDATIKQGDHPAYGWEANPWVWVIEFERRGKPESGG